MSSSHQTIQIPKTLYCILLIVISTFLFYFYGEHTAFEWATTQDLSNLLRIIHPDILPNDFYTNATIRSPRDFYILILSIPIQLGFNIHKVLYCFKLLMILTQKPLFFLSVFAIVNQWIKNKPRISMEIIKFLIFIYVAVDISYIFDFHIAEWYPVQAYKYLIPQSFAACFGLLYIFLTNSNKSKRFYEMLTLFITTCIHPVMGLFFFLFNIIFNLPIITSVKIKNYIKDLFFGVLIPLIAIKLIYSTPSIISTKNFIEYYVVYRHPHHYLMSYTLTIFFVKIAFLYLSIFIISLFLKNKKMIYLSFLCLISYVATAFVQYIGTEVIPTKLVVLLGPSRFFSFTPIILSTEIIILLSIIYSKFNIKFTFLAKLHNKSYVLREYFQNHSPRYFLALILIFSTIFLFISTYVHPLKERKNMHLAPIIQWILTNTPKDSTIHVEDGVIFPSLIRIIAKRAVLGDYVFPFNERDIKEFYDRYKIYKNSWSFKNDDYYRISKFFQLNYVLTDGNQKQRFKGYPLVYKDEFFNLFEVQTYKNNAIK